MSAKTKFTRRPDDSGWLQVMLTISRSLASLCEYTRVELLREVDGRVYFSIAAGNSSHLGKEASLKKENADRYLADEGPTGPAQMLVQYTGIPMPEVSRFQGYQKQQWARAEFNGDHAQVTLNSVWDSTFTPIPAGAHLIMAPEQSHANISTRGYRMATPGLRCTDVWFPIQLEGKPGNSSRYVHVGHLSEGCVTVHELYKWDAVYDYLIGCRMPGSGGKFVGRLTVRE